VLFLAVAGCAAAAGQRSTSPTIAVAPIEGCDAVRVAAVKLAAMDGVWTLPVEINGSRLRLLLDTGAERTLLSQATVARLGMRRDAGHQTQTFGIGGLSTTDDALVSSFSLGGAYLPLPSVTVGSFGLPAGLDGMLGADVLSAFDVDLDARDGRLTLYRARDCPQTPPPWHEPYLSMGEIRRQRDRLLVPIVVDDTAGFATLDTGAQDSAVSEAMAARVGVGADSLAADPTVSAHGAAADGVTVRVHRFRRLRIGPSEITDPVLPVVPIPEGLGDGLAGADFMAGRRLWLSYASLKVFVTPLRIVAFAR
jgi:predicted aspartyl protease